MFPQTPLTVGCLPLRSRKEGGGMSPCWSSGTVRFQYCAPGLWNSRIIGEGGHLKDQSAVLPLGSLDTWFSVEFVGEFADNGNPLKHLETLLETTHVAVGLANKHTAPHEQKPFIWRNASITAKALEKLWGKINVKPLRRVRKGGLVVCCYCTFAEADQCDRSRCCNWRAWVAFPEGWRSDIGVC